MSIPSHKSTPRKSRATQEPQRSNGKLRVSAILQAAASVIDEKGYDLATMSEIADRSATKIGSLYRFFPNKERIADTLIVRARENIDLVFDEFDAVVASLPVQALTQSLLDLIFGLFTIPALMALLDAGQHWTVRRDEFRAALLERLARTLMLHSPALSNRAAQDIALIVLLNAKTVVTYRSSTSNTSSNLKIEVLEMTRLYLTSKLS